MVIYLSPLVNSEYPCEMIPILNVVLFKTADSSLDIREKAAQLLQLLERYSSIAVLSWNLNCRAELCH